MTKHKIQDEDYTNLLEIDTFRVVKDTKFKGNQQRGQNNVTEHWIAHMCDPYLNEEDGDNTPTGPFDATEINEGKCAYCHTEIPEAIIALWSLLEWEEAGDVLHSAPDSRFSTPVREL